MEGVQPLGLEQSLVIHLSNIIGTEVVVNGKGGIAAGHHFLIVGKVDEQVAQAVAGHHPQPQADLIAGIARRRSAEAFSKRPRKPE